MTELMKNLTEIKSIAVEYRETMMKFAEDPNRKTNKALKNIHLKLDSRLNGNRIMKLLIGLRTEGIGSNATLVQQAKRIKLFDYQSFHFIFDQLLGGIDGAIKLTKEREAAQ